MSDNSILYGLVGLSVTLTLGYLSKATSKRVVANEHGQYLMHMHRMYYILGIIGVVFGLVFLVSTLIVDDPDLFLYILAFLVPLLMGGLGVLSVLYYRRHYVLFDDTKLEVGNPFGHVRNIHWNEIVKVKFNPSSGLLTLTTGDGNKVKVHYHLIGFTMFVEQLEKSTRWTAKELKLPVRKK